MVSVVESDVSFYSTLEKAVGCLSDLGMSRKLCVEQTDVMFTLVSGKDLLTVLPTSFGKSLIFQMLVRIKQIMMATKYCVRSVGRSVFHGIDRSFTNGLSFGKCRGWQIPTHICLCAEVLSKPLLSLLTKTASRFHQNMCAIVVDESHTMETWTEKGLFPYKTVFFLY